MICFIAYRDDPQLIQRVTESVPQNVELFVLNNNPKGNIPKLRRNNTHIIDVQHRYHLAQAMNLFCNIAIELKQHHFFFMHADCVLRSSKVLEHIVDEIQTAELNSREWLMISGGWTDIICAFNTESFKKIGGYDDTFVYSWMEIDFIRRGVLAGLQVSFLRRDITHNLYDHYQANVRKFSEGLNQYWKIVDHHDWLYWCKKWGEQPEPYTHSTRWVNLNKIPFNHNRLYDRDRSTIQTRTKLLVD